MELRDKDYNINHMLEGLIRQLESKINILSGRIDELKKQMDKIPIIEQGIGSGDTGLNTDEQVKDSPDITVLPTDSIANIVYVDSTAFVLSTDEAKRAFLLNNSNPSVVWDEKAHVWRFYGVYAD